MHRMSGGSCSTETRSVETPKPDARVPASLEAGERGLAPLLTDRATPPDQPDAGPAISLAEPRKREERS
jgi:hypothetical protein